VRDSVQKLTSGISF
jgi:hypothetical protein